MNAQELHLADGKPTGVYFCGECRIVNRDKEKVEACCVPPPPRICPECSQSAPDGLRFHPDCLNAKRVREAEKLDDWDGFVWQDHAGYKDGYFESLSDYAEWLFEEDVPADEWPEYVFACKEIPFKGADMSSIIENITCDMFDDADDHLKGVKELTAAVEVFNEANAGLSSWDADMKRVVRVPSRAAWEEGVSSASLTEPGAEGGDDECQNH